MEIEDLGLKSALDSVTDRCLTSAKNRSEPPISESEKTAREGWLRWQSLIGKIGSRYAGCRLANFEISADAQIAARQRSVVESLRDYCGNISERVSDGQSVILVGPPGTGKDHLVAAMMRAGCRANLPVDWINGSDFFGMARDVMDGHTSERQFVGSFTIADALAISDPVPPSGPLNDWRTELLLRVVDARYRRKKPLWITLNVENRKEAVERLSVQMVDRLRHDSLILECQWPSFRNPA